MSHSHEANTELAAANKATDPASTILSSFRNLLRRGQGALDHAGGHGNALDLGVLEGTTADELCDPGSITLVDEQEEADVITSARAQARRKDEQADRPVAVAPAEVPDHGDA